MLAKYTHTHKHTYIRTLLPRYVWLVPDPAGVTHKFNIGIGYFLRLGVRVNARPPRTVILDLRRRLATTVYGGVRCGTLKSNRKALICLRCSDSVSNSNAFKESIELFIFDSRSARRNDGRVIEFDAKTIDRATTLSPTVPLFDHLSPFYVISARANPAFSLFIKQTGKLLRRNSGVAPGATWSGGG